MNTDDYRYILTIAEEKSITRAAEKLFITQPALSQRIKYVRKELGIELFINDKDGLHLTSDGRCFARYAQRIIQEEENMKRELQEIHNLDSGSLTIGVSQMSTSRYFKRLVSRFHTLYPNVKINIVELPSKELRRCLLNGKVDLGILHMPYQNALSHEYSYEVIFHDRLVFLPGTGSSLKKYFFHKSSFEIPYISPQILINEPLALPESDTVTFCLFNHILQTAGVEPTVNHWSRSYAALTSLTEMGLANTVLLQSYLGNDVQVGDYSFMDTSEKDNIPTVIAYVSNRYIPKIMGQFIGLAKETWDSIYPYQV